MRVLLRADAGHDQGTGHVMRCLALSEQLLERGHDVILMTAPGDTPWLASAIADAGVTVVPCAPGELDPTAVTRLRPDWVCVDSYLIDAAAISALRSRTLVLAIVDGSERGIDADRYLDQNLGAEELRRPGDVAERMLAGPSYALVRGAILAQRRPEPWRTSGTPPKVVAFIGGTDPGGVTVRVCAAIAAVTGLAATVVARVASHDAIRALLPTARLVAPTPGLPAILGGADLIVSAAGTSAWDVCTLAIPAVLIAAVPNQVPSLTHAVSGGLVLGVDASDDEAAIGAALPGMLAALRDDGELRRRLSTRSGEVFDGFGARRVAEAMEQALD